MTSRSPVRSTALFSVTWRAAAAIVGSTSICFGHQIVAHRQPATDDQDSLHRNPVDGHAVPVPHFGVVLDLDAWKALRDRLVAAGVGFEIEPHIRFEGQVGEQATMFFRDPSGNALEFKAFRDLSQLFAK